MYFGSLPTRLILDLTAYINAGSILAHFSVLSETGDNIFEKSANIINRSSSYFQVVGDQELTELCLSSKDSSKPARLIIIELEQFLTMK